MFNQSNYLSHAFQNSETSVQIAPSAEWKNERVVESFSLIAEKHGVVVFSRRFDELSAALKHANSYFSRMQFSPKGDQSSGGCSSCQAH
jgi:hypothetical protein